MDQVKTVKNSVKEDERAKIQQYLETLSAQREGGVANGEDKNSTENMKKMVR